MKFNNNIYFFFFMIILAYIIIFNFGNNYINEKESEILKKKYSNISNLYQEKIDVLINKKRNATLAFTLSFANGNSKLVDFILNKSDFELKSLSAELRKHTDFKNVWFQIIDKNGYSLYKSWTEKKGDNISSLRSDVKENLKNPQPMTSISIGRFDITFKARVPLYNKDEFIGFIETITHFNSIVKSLNETDKVFSLVLVDKEYTNRLKENSFSKIFVQNHYIANLSVNKEIIKYIKKENITSLLNIKDYLIKDDFIIINHPLFYKDKKLASFLVFKKLSSVDMKDVKDFKYHAISYLISFLVLIILVIFIFFYYLYSKKLKNVYEKLRISKKELQELNENLQVTIKDEVRKNEQKNKLLFQQNKMAAMGEMIENIAHQWRQPLSLITTEASSIKVKKEYGLLDDEELFTSVESIVDTSNYLSHTIDDFRNYFSPNKNKNFFNSLKFIQKCKKLINHELKTNKIKFIESIDNIEINSYENELVQIVINILNNAKDELVNSKDEKDRFIFFDLYDDENNVYFDIKDSAGGIDEELIDRVFEPYFTTKHKSKGTGIGLYMCEQIIERHLNGSIKVKNERYKYHDKNYTGAVFKLSFPK